MNKLKNFFAAFCATLLVTGCANVKSMGPDSSAQVLDTSKESIVLATLDLRRPDGSRYIPHPAFVRIQKTDVEGNDGMTIYRVDKDVGKAESELSNTFWFRLPLEPGNYNLRSISGAANAFPFVGFFDIPILINFSVPKDSVSYIGRIEAILRPRQGNEFRAGAVVPLIDQSVTGISGGTFDVTIRDGSEADLPTFTTRFPVLNNRSIQKSILSPWDREKAQVWWENGGKESPITKEGNNNEKGNMAILVDEAK